MKKQLSLGNASDPRELAIASRLSKIKRIIAVTGWKGGIGKSSVACALSMALAKTGSKTGLFDADLTGACCHIILGSGKSFPAEIEGLEPPVVAGVKFMSASFFSGNNAVALRGEEISQSLLELLAVTQWRELDFLIIDMPPGISDASLELLRLIPRAELLIVSTPSRLSEETLRRSLKLFKQLGSPVTGIVENMSRKAAGTKPSLGAIPFDPHYESAVGNPLKIEKTDFFKSTQAIALKIKTGPSAGHKKPRA